MAYFKHLPEIEYVNRFRNTKSNDEKTVAKNLFRRPKVREDIASFVSAFERYIIVEGERPEQIAQKVYGNPELDWVIIMTNNIIDMYSDWPMPNSELNRYLENKYTEEELLEIHHYETIETKDQFGRLLFPAGLEVDKTFYDAPQYQALTEDPPGITFPIITLPAIEAEIVTTIQNYSVATATITSEGRGYKKAPLIGFSAPPITINATASAEIGDFHVTNVTGINTGKGYRTPPTITVSEPPESVQATAEVVVDNLLKVTGGTISTTGAGYGLTAPNITFSLPPDYITGSRFEATSGTLVGNDVDGMMVKPDGYKVYTTSMIGSDQVKEFYLTNPWDVTTLTFQSELDVSADFSYTNGIHIDESGSRMYVTGGKSGVQKVKQYLLNTPWDLQSAQALGSYDNLDAPGGVRLHPDGNKMYIVDGGTSDSINTYTLSIDWDVSTATFESTFAVGTAVGDNDIVGMTFGDNGYKLYVVGQAQQTVHEFNLSVPYDLSTAVKAQSLYLGTKAKEPCDIFVKEDDKEKFFVMSGQSNKVSEFEIRARAKGNALINSTGNVTGIQVTRAGRGYVEPPTLTIDPPITARTATVTPVMEAGEFGDFVSGYNITDAGFGYLTAPTVTVSQPPEHRNAAGEVSMEGGKITNINVTDAGANYYSAPTVTFNIMPEDVVNTAVGDEYSADIRTWRWSGTSWELELTKAFEYLDVEGQVQSFKGTELSRPVTNYEYEVRVNESKRIISLPKAEYIPVLEDELRTIMKYDKKLKSSKGSKLTTTYNPKLRGI